MPKDEVPDTAAESESNATPPGLNPAHNGVTNDAGGNSSADQVASTTEEPVSPRDPTPPPLPQRPSLSAAGSLRLSKRASRPQLQSTATTALSRTDVHTQAHSDAASTHPSPTGTVSRRQSATQFGRLGSIGASEADDSASVSSLVTSVGARFESESILGDVRSDHVGPVWIGRGSSSEYEDPFDSEEPEDEALNDLILHEFDDLGSIDDGGSVEDLILAEWKSKLKHFFILSASGKPIYSRHGDDQLTSHYIGVAQTLISFYQDADDALRGFTAGGTRFVMLSKGPLNLIAVSRLGESEAQLRTQLESLYMQILSTLTLPSMERMFSLRPSTDLRRPLQGTDVLLDGLADGFTRGSPSTLLSALECLRLRKTHRKLINESLLKVRSPNLLYGLIVAAGRLVSVVRPKKHSLHPGDLHLIFNMLFEAGSVRAAGGENWIPLCLPGFNNTGFLHMYVAFFSTDSEKGVAEAGEERPSSRGKQDEELATVLISANPDAFFELRKMRDDLFEQLNSNGSMDNIKKAISQGHASCADILPRTVLKHFLYKSRANVQFAMSSFEPHFKGIVARRRLLTLYHQLHESVHSRTAHLKVQHIISSDATALAWETPLFELYCVAGPQASRALLTNGANRVVQWAKREEERLFIIGGAVF